MIKVERHVMFSVYCPRESAYVIEEQGALIEVRSPQTFPSLEGVAQWVGDGRTLKQLVAITWRERAE